MNASSCVALLLAAGGARRFAKETDGAHKLLADLGGEPVVRVAATALVDVGFSRIVAVTGARGDEVAGALEALPIEIVHNGDWADGMGGSIALGARHVAASQPDAILLALADMPLLRPSDHAAVLAAQDDDPATITRGMAAERPGHPVVFGSHWFDALTTLRGDAGAASILRGRGVRLVPLDRDTQRDVDTPDALEKVRRIRHERAEL